MVSVVLEIQAYQECRPEVFEGRGVNVGALRRVGRDLFLSYYRTAEVVEKLDADGWDISGEIATCCNCGPVYEVLCEHPEVETVGEAEARLERLGIDKDDPHLFLT